MILNKVVVDSIDPTCSYISGEVYGWLDWKLQHRVSDRFVVTISL